MKTVLITGCSSGYGQETARHFHALGWKVIATMRTPREDLLPRSDRLRVLALDVTRPESIAAALEASGPIDVLVNNAGIGLFGAFEATPMPMVAFGVTVKLVEPGYGPTTRFASNGAARMEGLVPEPYAPFAQRIFASFTQVAAATVESDVAETVWRAANDVSGQLRFPAGADAVALARPV